MNIIDTIITYFHIIFGIESSKPTIKLDGNIDLVIEEKEVVFEEESRGETKHIVIIDEAAFIGSPNIKSKKVTKKKTSKKKAGKKKKASKKKSSKKKEK